MLAKDYPVTANELSPDTLRQHFGSLVRRGVFRPILRFLPVLIAEEQLQDAICQTYEMYERYAERGKILPDAILVHSCRQRAVDPNRRFVKADGCQPKRDVYDPRNYLEGRLELLRFDGAADEDGRLYSEEGDVGVEYSLYDAFVMDPSEHLDSAIDLLNWFKKLAPHDQKLVALRLAGYTLGEIADELRLPITVVCHRCLEIGTMLAEIVGIELQAVKRERKPRVKKTKLAA